MSVAKNPTKTKPAILTIDASLSNYPRITLSGAWLRYWGFNIGDRISLVSLGPGSILVRKGTWPDWQQPTRSNEPQHIYPADPYDQKRRSYRLAPSLHDTPEIVLAGAWLREWGFAAGDRIHLTWQWENNFGIEVIQRNTPTPAPTQSETPQKQKPSAYELLMTATREYYATKAARRFAELAKTYPCLND